jgi:hypothetical protein
MRRQLRDMFRYPLGLWPGSEIRLLEDVSVPVEFERERILPAGYVLEVGKARDSDRVEFVDFDGQTYSWRVGEVPRYERVRTPVVLRILFDLLYVTIYAGLMLLISYFTSSRPITSREWLMRAFAYAALGALVWLFTRSSNRGDRPTIVR